MAGAQRWGRRGGSYKITSATAGGENLKFMGKEDGDPPKAENAQGGRVKIMSYMGRWVTLSGVGSLGAIKYKWSYAG